MIGSTVGNYKIIDKLGEGGMGVVYLAEHTMIGRRAAVKMLLPELSSNKDILHRFFNEARSTSIIKHAGMVDIYDFGYHPSGSAYIVMEFLEGESLAARLRRERKLRLDALLPIVRQLAGVLSVAHAKGIVHRDLKPDNVFLVPDRDVAGGIRVKVLDFGIAKLAHDATAGTHKTRTGMVMGTPIYMSPEQCRGAGEVDARADIYSLGCMIFEMAGGRPPFVAEGYGEIIGMQQFTEPPKLRSFDPAISPHLEAIVMRTLAKRPAERPQTMDALSADLDRLGSRQDSSVAPTLVATEPPVRQEPPPSTLDGAAGQKHTAVPTRSRSRTVGAAIGAVVVLAGVGVVWKMRGQGDDHSKSDVADAAVEVAVVQKAPADAAVLPMIGAMQSTEPAVLKKLDSPQIETALKPTSSIDSPPPVKKKHKTPVAEAPHSSDLRDPFNERPKDVPAEDNKARGEKVYSEAQDQYVHGQYENARTTARTAIKLGVSKAWRIVGASSCFLKDRPGAQEAWRASDQMGRQFLKYVCSRNAIELP